MSAFLTDIEQQDIAGSEALEPKYRLMQIPCYMEDRLIDLNNITLDDIDWKIIARVLSRMARFNGQTGQGCAYSYAQHSVIGADVLAKETNDSITAGYFLLLDVHKAFFGDVPQPVKQLIYKKLKSVFVLNKLNSEKFNFMELVFKKAALPTIHDYDKRFIIYNMHGRLLAAECLTFFKHAKQQFGDIAQYKIPPIKPIGAALAEERYVERLQRYLGIKL